MSGWIFPAWDSWRAPYFVAAGAPAAAAAVATQPSPLDSRSGALVTWRPPPPVDYTPVLKIEEMPNDVESEVTEKRRRRRKRKISKEDAQNDDKGRNLQTKSAPRDELTQEQVKAGWRVSGCSSGSISNGPARQVHTQVRGGGRGGAGVGSRPSVSPGSHGTSSFSGGKTPSRAGGDLGGSHSNGTTPARQVHAQARGGGGRGGAGVGSRPSVSPGSHGTSSFSGAKPLSGGHRGGAGGGSLPSVSSRSNGTTTFRRVIGPSGRGARADSVNDSTTNRRLQSHSSGEGRGGADGGSRPSDSSRSDGATKFARANATSDGGIGRADGRSINASRPFFSSHSNGTTTFARANASSGGRIGDADGDEPSASTSTFNNKTKRERTDRERIIGIAVEAAVRAAAASAN